MPVTLCSQSTQRTAVSGSSEAGDSDVEDRDSSDDNSASSAHTAVEEDELADRSGGVDAATSKLKAPGRWSPLYDP